MTIEVTNLQEAIDFGNRLNGCRMFPIHVRPLFTLNGAGARVVVDIDMLAQVVKEGLNLSPVYQVTLFGPMHKYVEHPTYTGNGCAQCGELKDSYIHDNSSTL